MSRVIVLSNRVKMPEHKAEGKNRSAGGLAVALYDALHQNGGVWLGWNGEVNDTFDSVQDNVFDSEPSGKVTYMTTAFSPEQYRHFYCGFANNVLWALLHDRADIIAAMSKADIDQDFAVYQQVNAQFAKQLQRIAQPDDVIWVHDYHFFGVADYCRKLGMTQRIGFFLHIPFAPSEVWHACPHADTLLCQLAQYDVIGVQTQADKRHCLDVMTPFLANIANQPLINAYPIGVDVATIAEQISPKIAAYHRLNPVEKLEKLPMATRPIRQIIAVDRVDYSKGILRRLQAFASFLQAYPEYQGKVQLVQIACPSRLDLPAYRELYEAVKQQVAQIQQVFATKDWQPIIYSETVLSHDKLMVLFVDSEICWVNSLKDGMNLVAKEYVAAQNPADPGVLLLSKYAGASEQMTAAVIIDPYDEQNLVDSLLIALTMSHAARQTRYQSLISGLKAHDLTAWQIAFLQDLRLTFKP